ncbi:marine proteobacterial sortase target protein [Thauera sp. SDU_THAU2]|uniref:marine proteobacterial sortase target protein n=1 Tax=Thauera sp. SDU_THAU2 TaxID=3136633 RepID=UPI00311EA539
MNTHLPGSARRWHDLLEIAALAARIFLVGLLVAFALAVLTLLFAAPSYAGEGDTGQGTLIIRLPDGNGVALPALDTEVAIRVNGPLARTRVVQTFHNASDGWQEGEYLFPLPENAAVDRLRMVIGEHVVEGEIRERAAARAEFEQARASGRRTALVEQQRPNLFTTRVANIAPGARISVEIEYQQTLEWRMNEDGGHYGLRFPMVAAPRYLPLPTTAEEIADAQHITAPVRHPAAGPAINPVRMRVELDAGMPLSALRSPSHALRVDAPHANRRVVEFADGAAPAERDFVLEWTLAAGQAPRVALFAERGQDVDHALLMLMPPRLPSDGRPLAREVVFVIDTSGSMAGASIAQARAALALALRRLRPEDRFNVIEFNSATRALFDAARPASADNVEHAARWVRKLDATGGTEMAPALAAALGGGADPERVRQVIFLTDGAVGNEETLFRLIEQRLGDARLFPVGIGSAPNGHFMRKAAAAGRGSFTYIGRLDEVQERMSALFERLEAPMLKDIELAWPDGAQADYWPRKVPDLYAGEPLAVAVALRRASGTLKVGGRGPQAAWNTEVDLGRAAPGSGLGALWARHKIDALLDLLRSGTPEDEVRPQIVELALAHRLVSRYTSLVAVDKTPVRPAAAPLQGGRLPLNLPAGWQYEKVFGQLPTGATDARMHLLGGTLTLALGALLFALTRRRNAFA